MLQKVATVLYITIQFAFIACALVVVSESESEMPSVVGVATFMVAYYTLGTSSWRILNVIFCQKTPDRKGMMDL